MNVKETLTEVFQDVFDDDELELFDEMTAEILPHLKKKADIPIQEA